MYEWFVCENLTTNTATKNQAMVYDKFIQAFSSSLSSALAMATDNLPRAFHWTPNMTAFVLDCEQKKVLQLAWGASASQAITQPHIVQAVIASTETRGWQRA